MAAALITVLSLTVLGIPFVLAVDRDAPPLRLLGLAVLYGTGAIYFALLALSVLHVKWTLLSVTIAVLLIVSPFLRSLSTQHSALSTRLHVVDILALITPIAFSIYATMVAIWQWDFWAIWGLKARVFLERGGIDWRFLESRWNLFTHPDYPLLVPFAYDFAALVNGGWSDRWLGVLFVAWAVAFLLVARELAGREVSPLAAALVGVVMSSAGISIFVGLAEGALIAYLGAGVLFVRRALLFDDAAAWRHGAILLGLAACTKNEGVAMIASVAIAISIVDARRVVRLWPAAAIALPWLVLRALHRLPSDVVSGSLVERVAAHASEAGTIFKLLVRSSYQPWLWAAMLFGFLVVPMASRERFVLLATLFQLLVYIAVYFATPHDVAWHIRTSWTRLTLQVAPPLAFAVMIELARHAEARSEQQ
ncbi:MAG TPA: hypothetical protein VJZ76_13285 [Thermoanaerobaculia bacterium]|nr:hypothetical protein [Thermoanaerobaculia bacterium]